MPPAHRQLAGLSDDGVHLGVPWHGGYALLSAARRGQGGHGETMREVTVIHSKPQV